MTRIPAVVAILFIAFCPNELFASGAGAGSRVAKEELIPAVLTAGRLGSTDIEIVWRKNNAYLPLVAIFRFLEVKVEFSTAKSVVTGFYPTEKYPFSIDLLSGKSKMRDTTATLTTEEYTFSEDDVYLREDVLRSLFKMDISYSPRRLAVMVAPDENLPAVQAYARAQARKRLLFKPEEVQPDFSFPRTTSWLSGGKLDWNITSQTADDQLPRTTYRFDLGGKFLEGDLDADVSGLLRYQLREQNVNGLLSYPVDSTSLLKIVEFGGLQPSLTSPFSVFGAEITNAPYMRRILFSQQQISASLPANSEVEFYARSRLIDYLQTTSDTVSRFSFPLAYGVGDYETKVYDQWGNLNDSRFQEVIPLEMIPPNELDYAAAGGIIRGYNKGAGYFSVDRGFTPVLTLGAGADYYEPGFAQRSLYPYVNGTVRLLSSLYGDVVVSPLSSSTASLQLQLPNQLILSVSQAVYAQDAVLNPSEISSQSTMSFSTPIVVGSASGITASANGSNTVGELSHQRAITASVYGYVPNYQLVYTGTYVESNGIIVQESSNPSINVHTPVLINVQAGFTYDHALGEFRSINVGADRVLFRSLYLQFTLERLYDPNFTFALLRLNYTLPFLHGESSAQRQYSSGSSATTYENSGSGSILFSSATGDLLFQSGPLNGRGALLVKPFIDANGNDKYDQGEEYLPATQVFSHGLYTTPSSTLRSGGTLFMSVEPYLPYYTSLDSRYFDNPLWVPAYQMVQITAEPNMLKVFDFPIEVGGNIHGQINFVGTNGSSSPVEALTVTLRHKGGERKIIKTMKTFSTGEFEFNAVLPGSYEISLDQAELSALGVTANVMTKDVTVRPLAEGDQVTGVDFELK